MKRYYGIGLKGYLGTRISLFWGTTILTIAFWTSIYKFRWRFYKYTNVDFDDTSKEIKWFIGFETS